MTTEEWKQQEANLETMRDCFYVYLMEHGVETQTVYTKFDTHLDIFYLIAKIDDSRLLGIALNESPEDSNIEWHGLQLLDLTDPKLEWRLTYNKVKVDKGPLTEFIKQILELQHEKEAEIKA